MLTEPSVESVEFEHPVSSASTVEPGSLGTPPRKALLRKIIVALVIAGAAGFAAWKIHQNMTEATPTGRRGGDSADRAVPIRVAAVQQKEMPIYLTAPGTVTAYYAVTIRTRVDGQLLSVNIREGQSVKKGQLLAEIDPAPYQAALAQAEGQLARDQAAAVYATAAAERYKTLYDTGVVSKDREQTQTAAAGQADGAVVADKAAIQAAKVNLAFTRITSPINGVVGLRQVDPGNIVHAADATGLMLVTQLQPIAAIFTLPEDQLPEVQKALRDGGSLAVEAYDHGDTTLLGNGKLLTLDNQIDTTTGTDRVKAVFDNKDGSLFPNQFVNARLILKKEPNALVIPAAAVQTGSSGTFVYVIKHGDPPKGGGSRPGGDASKSGHEDGSKGDKPKADGASLQAGADNGGKGHGEGKFYVAVRPIVVNVIQGSQVIVESGLAAGEQVVIDGLEKLKDGSVVTPRQNGEHNGSGSGKHKSSDSGGADKSGDAQGSARQQPQSSADSGKGSGKHGHSGHGKQS
jgi:multidrug efflux system membrane fusion protein